MKTEAWLKTLPDESLRSLELREWREDEADAYVDLLVQLKANQKTTLEEATRRLNQSAPPFYTQIQNSAMDA